MSLPSEHLDVFVGVVQGEGCELVAEAVQGLKLTATLQQLQVLLLQQQQTHFLKERET